RLERLQRVVTKLQMESGLCEEQLNQADTLLQADVRLLAAGKAPQKAAEVERDLDKADAMIRLLFNEHLELLLPPTPGGVLQGHPCPCSWWSLHIVPTPSQGSLKSPGPPSHPCSRGSPALGSLPSPHHWDDAGVLWEARGPGGVRDACVRGVGWGVPTLTARLPQAQLSPGPRSAYRECLGKLDLQMMGRMWGMRGRQMLQPPRSPPQNSSKARLRHLESLHGFVSAATKELLWLSEKEEEEVTFDWSHRNPNMAAKKDNYS
ncbi:PLEC protein, partial [Eurystomus gularis]|nr:PLEC protein [Eurystomus gularis]